MEAGRAQREGQCGSPFAKRAGEGVNPRSRSHSAAQRQYEIQHSNHHYCAAQGNRGRLAHASRAIYLWSVDVRLDIMPSGSSGIRAVEDSEHERGWIRNPP
jgi:hypothetical protein